MDNTIRINGLTFSPYLTSEMIKNEVARVGAEIRRDLDGKEPIFITVLNGAFIFAADLIRAIGITDCRTAFVRYASYEGTQSTGKVRQLIGLNEDVAGRDLLIIEDIVDTGYTAEKMIDDLKKLNPASVRFATLLYKPESSKTGFVPDYRAFDIPSKFIVGYGLDLDGKGRNLPDIYSIVED
ncbi:MAG: hypoxanthine phosphoribosyltransferase [Bacteroides sp.]|nr:hypoxanthine phosphoribosyltransferase [Bacteroides sp.]